MRPVLIAGVLPFALGLLLPLPLLLPTADQAAGACTDRAPCYTAYHRAAAHPPTWYLSIFERGLAVRQVTINGQALKPGGADYKLALSTDGSVVAVVILRPPAADVETAQVFLYARK